MSEHQEQIIACNPTAIHPDEREAHGLLAKEIFSSSTILETSELPDGYSFRLPLETSLLHNIVKWIANERLCCPFFTFNLIVGEQLRLQLQGTKEVKELIRLEILPMIGSGNFPTMDALQAVYKADNASEAIPIACDPNALTSEQQERWMIVGKQMYSAIEEIRDLPNGYAFRLPGTADMLMLIAEDLTMERLCCPFLHFTIQVDRMGEPFWLTFTGGEGAKAFVRASIEGFNLLDADVARIAGFDVSGAKDIDSVDSAIKAANVVNALISNGEDGG